MEYNSGSSGPDYRFDSYGISKQDILKYSGAAVLLLIVAMAGFVWFVCRIDVPRGHFVAMVKKTGENMTNTDILVSGDKKGPRFEILKEGRHFRNPYVWGWSRPIEATVIPEGNVGILTRLVGDPLPKGNIIARQESQKGIVREPLMPGRHYLSLREYDVEIAKMVNIKRGWRGVITRLVGDEPENPNVFVVADGERGTQPSLLGPAVHHAYSNHHIYLVTPVNIQSQKFEMAGDYAITFPSTDGFDIRVEGTIEWAPDEKMLPELFVKYVDEQDMEGFSNIKRKIILPFARSYFRTIGGRYRAVDYITGDTRTQVQKDVELHLKEDCQKQGVIIRSFIIRSTDPPAQIRDQYQRRELAKLQQARFGKEIATEIGSPVLVDGKVKVGPEGKEVYEGGRLEKIIQERRKDRETQLGGVRVKVAQAFREAEQYRIVEVTKAEKELAVAKITLEASRDNAATILAQGIAAAEVTVMKHKAEAQAVKAKIDAFDGKGEKYAEYQLITKMAPGMSRVLSNTEGLFAKLFERFSAMGEK